jgi:sulfite exporter TauE/SafE
MDSTVAVPVDVSALCFLAVTIGFVHTLTGPDHYVPFVAMSQAGRWSLPKTILITVLCGFGHVGSSIAIGLIGVVLGVMVLQLENLDAFRGNLAGWLLVVFGLVYFSWGIVHARRHTPHYHWSLNLRGLTIWRHEHCHQSEQQSKSSDTTSMMPWVLAIIFVLGPCEPLIPLLMYPAAKANALAVVGVTTLFALVTLVTMTTMVVLMRLGMQSFRLHGLNQYAHAVCGFAMLACGLLVKFGGL